MSVAAPTSLRKDWDPTKAAALLPRREAKQRIMKDVRALYSEP